MLRLKVYTTIHGWKRRLANRTHTSLGARHGGIRSSLDVMVRFFLKYKTTKHKTILCGDWLNSCKGPTRWKLSGHFPDVTGFGAIPEASHGICDSLNRGDPLLKSSCIQNAHRTGEQPHPTASPPQLRVLTSVLPHLRLGEAEPLPACQGLGVKAPHWVTGT